jgi:hypothetical protein
MCYQWRGGRRSLLFLPQNRGISESNSSTIQKQMAVDKNRIILLLSDATSSGVTHRDLISGWAKSKYGQEYYWATNHGTTLIIQLQYILMRYRIEREQTGWEMFTVQKFELVLVV